jgi:hypothetical protein
VPLPRPFARALARLRALPLPTRPERRAEPRIVPTRPLRAQVAGLEGEVLDVSPGGLAIRAAIVAAPGARLPLALPELGLEEAWLCVVEARGGVVRGRLEGRHPAMRARLDAHLGRAEAA